MSGIRRIISGNESKKGKQSPSALASALSPESILKQNGGTKKK